MLRWLPSALYSKSTERQHFLQDIVLFVFGAHVLLLLMMVGATLFDGKSDRYSISMHQTGATYVLMPLQKKVDQPKQAKRSDHAAYKKSRVVNYEDYQRQKKLQQVVAKKAIKKIPVIATSKAKNSLQKIMQQDRATAALVDDRKPAHLKKGQLNKKKNKVKMVEAVVPPVVSPEEALPVKPETVAPAVQNKVDVAAQDVKPTTTNEATPNQAAAEPLSQQSDSQEFLDSFDTDNVLFVGYEQLEQCVVSSKIQQSIQQCWTPPIGIAAGTSCQMRVTVSAQGTAQAVKIEQSSGVLVYDTSAKAALFQVEYPQEVYNKTITIVLGN